MQGCGRSEGFGVESARRGVVLLHDNHVTKSSSTVDALNAEFGTHPDPKQVREIVERLGKFNRKQRRGMLARARKQARAARKGEGK